MMIDWGIERHAVFESEHFRKQALECLRLESDCMQLAADSHNPKLQSHFIRMARACFTLAVSGPRAHAGHERGQGKPQPT
jgi:hypothetical protein